MVRTRVKGLGMGRTYKVEKEPDFYAMPPCYPGAVIQSTQYDSEPVRAAPIKPHAVHARDIHETTDGHCDPTRRNHWGDFPPPRRVSPTLSTLVTPMPEDGGRPIFQQSPPRVQAETVPSTDSSYSSEDSPLAYPVRTIAPRLPLIPLSFPESSSTSQSHHHTSYTLAPRSVWTEQDLADTALFEGLEFQVVDDDSLEQFESELIPDVRAV